MVFSAGYYEQKHIYTAWGERMEQFTERGSWDRLLYVHEDIMGNTRYYTKDNGQSFAELEYDVWGAVTSPSKLTNNDNGNFAAAVFTGHPYDTVLDIYFAEARFYDAKYRQWMASDPIKSGLNWYLYANGNPATYWDPNGLTAIRIDQILKSMVGQAKNMANEAWMNFEIWNQQRKEEYDREVERLGAEIREKNRLYEEELNRVQKQIRFEETLKRKERYEAYDRDVLRLSAEIRERNRLYEEEWNRVRKQIRFEETLKRKEEYEAYDRAVLARRREILAQQEVERRLWEAYYRDPTLPPTPLEELAGWAGGHLKNHVEDTKLYFRRITCEVEKASILALLTDPKEQAKFTIFKINEDVQLIGRILGDYNFTSSASIGLTVSPYGVPTASESINIFADMKGNYIMMHTHEQGYSGTLPIPEIPIMPFVSLGAMPGGNITDWSGEADNYGGSITWQHNSVGVDYVKLSPDDVDDELEDRIVITYKPSTDKIGVEGHYIHSETKYILNHEKSFNIHEDFDRKTKEVLNLFE